LFPVDLRGPGTSARYPTFTRPVEAVTPPGWIGVEE